jgi:hypothetical protein
LDGQRSSSLADQGDGRNGFDDRDARPEVQTGRGGDNLDRAPR